MNRVYQVILMGSTVALSWLGMQVVHELGHVAGAWLTGGVVAKVVLHPLTISYTTLSANPHPLFTVWAGPVLGSALPLVIWGVAWACNVPGTYLLRFFAGFCLIANGAYIGAGSFGRIGDAGVMLANGAALWQLWAFGLATVPAGLWLWHRQGKYFGLGKAARGIQPPVAKSLFGLLVLTVAIEMILFSKN
ncbi:MAG TPA: hypothetical protein VG099_00340 [Gemmataceae bacterium]|nr:hypothetical protein [Gemmataceae bacterium]